MDLRVISTIVLAALATAGCGESDRKSVSTAEQRAARPPAPARSVSVDAPRFANGDPDTLLGFRPRLGGAIVPETLEADDPRAIDLALDEVLYEPDPEARRMLIEWVGPAVLADARMAHRLEEFAYVEAEQAAVPAQDWIQGWVVETGAFENQTGESPSR
jgi:hypothetical protein